VPNVGLDKTSSPYSLDFWLDEEESSGDDDEELEEEDEPLLDDEELLDSIISDFSGAMLLPLRDLLIDLI
jgi:hypothetical protein